MSFFSLEYSESKMRMFTTMRHWGFFLLAASCAFSYLLIYLFRRDNQECTAYLELSVMCAFFTYMLLETSNKIVNDRKSGPFVTYLLFALLPVFILVYCISHYGEPFLSFNLTISLTVIVWLTISLLAGIWITVNVWRFADKNYHYDPSDFHTAVVQSTNGDGARWRYCFARSVEAYALTFATLVPLIAVFM